jgi:hypothetical protein
MNWTYLQLKQADALLGISDPGLSAANLNTQTTIQQTDINVSDIEKIVVPTGELFQITTLSNQTLSGNVPPTQKDEVIGFCWSFFRMLDKWTTIETSQNTVWQSCQTAMTILNTANVLSTNSINSIENLVFSEIPVWQPPITSGNIQTARTQ